MTERKFIDPVETRPFIDEVAIYRIFTLIFLFAGAIAIIGIAVYQGNPEGMDIGIISLVLSCFTNMETLRKKE